MFNDNIRNPSEITSPVLEAYSKEDQEKDNEAFTNWSSKSNIEIENDAYVITIDDPFDPINYPTKSLTIYPILGYTK